MVQWSEADFSFLLHCLKACMGHLVLWSETCTGHSSAMVRGMVGHLVQLLEIIKPVFFSSSPLFGLLHADRLMACIVCLVNIPPINRIILWGNYGITAMYFKVWGNSGKEIIRNTTNSLYWLFLLCCFSFVLCSKLMFTKCMI